MEMNMDNLQNNEAVTEALETAAEAVETAVNEPATLIQRTEDLLRIAPVGRLDTVMSGELKEQLEAEEE